MLTSSDFPASDSARGDFVRPGWLTGPRRLVRAAAAPVTFSGQGAAGPISYSLTATPTSPTRLDVSANLCLTAAAPLCGSAVGVTAQTVGQQPAGVRDKNLCDPRSVDDPT